jgi:hypothetical protein
VLLDSFADSECQEYMGTRAMHANGNCLSLGLHTSARILLSRSGSANSIYYANRFCIEQGAVNTFLVTAKHFQNHECVPAAPGSGFGSLIFYNNAFPGGWRE